MKPAYRPTDLFNKEDQNNFKILDQNVAGAEEEQKVFERFQKLLENGPVKDTLVISSWSDGGLKNDRENKEIDLLIISLPLKSIFQIEVKKISNKSNINHGVKQLKEGKKFFLSIIPFPSQEDWSFVQVVYFGTVTKTLKSCQNCQDFLLSDDTKLADWWTQLTKQFETKAKQEHPSPDTYLNTIKYLLFQMFLQDDCITKGSFH